MKIKLKGRPQPITILLALLLLLWMILLVALTDSWSIFGLTTGRRFQFFGTGRIVRHTLTTTSKRFESRRFRLHEGDALSLAYSVDVEEGSVHLYVMRVQRFPIQVDTVWNRTIRATGEDEITVPIPQSGRHNEGVHQCE